MRVFLLWDSRVVDVVVIKILKNKKTLAGLAAVEVSMSITVLSTELL